MKCVLVWRGFVTEHQVTTRKVSGPLVRVDDQHHKEDEMAVHVVKEFTMEAVVVAGSRR